MSTLFIELLGICTHCQSHLRHRKHTCDVFGRVWFSLVTSHLLCSLQSQFRRRYESSIPIVISCTSKRRQVMQANYLQCFSTTESHNDASVVVESNKQYSTEDTFDHGSKHTTKWITTTKTKSLCHGKSEIEEKQKRWERQVKFAHVCLCVHKFKACEIRKHLPSNCNEMDLGSKQAVTDLCDRLLANVFFTVVTTLQCIYWMFTRGRVCKRSHFAFSWPFSIDSRMPFARAILLFLCGKISVSRRFFFRLVCTMEHNECLCGWSVCIFFVREVDDTSIWMGNDSQYTSTVTMDLVRISVVLRSANAVCIRTVYAVSLWHLTFCIFECDALSHSLFPCALTQAQAWAWAQNSLLFSEMTHSHKSTAFCFWLQNEFTHHTRHRQRHRGTQMIIGSKQSTAAGEKWREEMVGEEWNQYRSRCSLSIACRFNAFLFFGIRSHNHT